MTRIAIRVDGDSGQEAGMGHVYRSLAFAKLFSKQMPDVDIQFFIREFPEGFSKVRGEGYPVHVLPRCPGKAHYEEAFKLYNPDLIIVDILGSTSELMDAGRGFARSIITLDDLEPSATKADVIVNGILWATHWLPERLGRAKVYQGVRYMPLREQFANANQYQRKISEHVKEIVVCTGGADICGFTAQFIRALGRLRTKCHVNIMAGPAFESSDDIRRIATRMNGHISFSIIENEFDMAKHLVKSDLALFTGGTVMFEAAACGIPAVVVCNYEHQVPQAEWFQEQGIAVNLGYFPDIIDQERVTRAIEELSGKPDLRKAMSTKGKDIVDGRGLSRLVEIVRQQLCN